MSNPALGTKRICPVTGRKFYDLNKDPIISPYTGQVVPISAMAARSRPEAGPVAQTDEAEVLETPGAEFVSLEQAEQESQATPKKVAPVDGEDDLEVEDDETPDDTFLEADEDEDDDVSDIIGDGIEDDEET